MHEKYIVSFQKVLYNKGKSIGEIRGGIHMKVILLQDIKGVGKKDQVINASDGYARNFLFPKKMAVPADQGNMARLQSKKDAQAYQKDLERQAAQKIADQIKDITLELKVKAGENGKIFGGVTSKEIAEALKNKYQITVDKKKIQLKETIKTLGQFQIEIKLFENITAKLKVAIKSE